MPTDTMTAAEYRARQAGGTSERSEQEALVKWAAASEGERPALALLFHIPNGGHRTARAGARLKRMGAKAGVPDLCLPVPVRLLTALLRVATARSGSR